MIPSPRRRSDAEEDPLPPPQLIVASGSPLGLAASSFPWQRIRLLPLPLLRLIAVLGFPARTLASPSPKRLSRLPPPPALRLIVVLAPLKSQPPPPVNRLPPPSPGVVADCRFGSSSQIGSPPLPGAAVDKMPSNGPFLDLETMGEDCGDGASWWKGRGWSEIKATMSNPVEHHWKNRREVSKITKRDLCKLFYSRFVR